MITEAIDALHLPSGPLAAATKLIEHLAWSLGEFETGATAEAEEALYAAAERLRTTATENLCRAAELTIQIQGDPC